MIKLLILAALLSVGTASAETSPPAPPAQDPTPAMVRNIGIAEQGDAIVVRKRKPEPVPATKSEQK